MFVIIHKIIWLYIIGITLGDLEMQPLVPKCKHGEVAGGFSTLPRTSAYQGFRLEEENSLHQGDSHHSHFLTHLPQRTSTENLPQRTSWRGRGGSILWESIAPSFIISKYRPQHQQCDRVRANPYPQKWEWYQFIHERTCQTKEVFVGIPNAI